MDVSTALRQFLGSPSDKIGMACGVDVGEKIVHNSIVIKQAVYCHLMEPIFLFIPVVLHNISPILPSQVTKYYLIYLSV